MRRLRTIIRVSIAFLATAVMAFVWMRVAKLAFFPEGGGEFHWVLHLARHTRTAGIYAFAATQALAAGLFTVLVCRPQKLRWWQLALGILVVVAGFNVFKHPLIGALSLVTGLPSVAVALGIWCVARRWPPSLPWVIVALLPLFPTLMHVGDFLHFFPPEVVVPAMLAAAGTGAAVSAAGMLVVSRTPAGAITSRPTRA